MHKTVLFLSCLYLILSLVSAHSWMQCADYAEENGRTWDQTQCRGWPRGYESIFGANGAFGQDAGYNYQPTDAAPCKPITGDQYTTNFPAATYNPGQRVCLAWPPKNHVAANCNNPNIPDHGTKIYRSGVNPTSDPTLTQFHQNLVADLGTASGTDGAGFQNCPQFCTNADKCLCTGCFQIPTNLALGKYTFLWEWAFNTDTDLYTSCFDVNIVANSGKYVTETYKKESADTYNSLKGQPDTPTINSPPTIVNGGGNGSGSSSGMSSGGAAVLALFIIALVGGLVGALLFVKLGYGTIDTKFPFFHKKEHTAYEYRGTNSNYVAYKEDQ